jgi:DNA replication protein DnaC
VAHGPPPLEVDRTRQQLLALGRAHAAESLAEELSEAVQPHRPAHPVLDRLLGRERGERDGRRIQTSLKWSGLPPGMTLGNFDFRFPPAIERRPIETLATGAFLREHPPLLVPGPPGVGQTHRVVALGVKAIAQGVRVAFDRLEDLRHEMGTDAPVSPQRLRRKKYCNGSYRVVDEVGFAPMRREDARWFCRLVSYRYRRGSTAIPTNQSVTDWPGIRAGDAAMTAAVLDCWRHQRVVRNVRGRS